MLIGGLQKFSLIDYPSKTAALIFTQGCNFSCHFCHNPSLVLKKASLINEEEIFEFLNKRKNQLDAVVITGGEPTIQKDLITFIKKIKNLNFLIKLDTNGTNPQMLKMLLEQNLLDYIAMDIKAPLEKYRLIIQNDIDILKINESINIILSSQIDYEFRTTYVKNLHVLDDAKNIAKSIKDAKLYILQRFVNKNTLNPIFKNYLPFSEKEMILLKKLSKDYVKNCEIR